MDINILLAQFQNIQEAILTLSKHKDEPQKEALPVAVPALEYIERRSLHISAQVTPSELKTFITACDDYNRKNGTHYNRAYISRALVMNFIANTQTIDLKNTLIAEEKIRKERMRKRAANKAIKRDLMKK
jgi:hypothetical protein